MISETLQEQIAQLQSIIDESHRVVFFGGAGVSTESGIPDFRSTDGLYHQQWAYPPETIISRSFFDADTPEFYRFYRAKLLLEGIAPNKAHLKLAEMEKAGKLTAVVTQNIDGLHQEAGSKKVYELHGSVLRNYCMRCHTFYDGEYMRKWIDDAAARADIAPEEVSDAAVARRWPEAAVPRCRKENCHGIVKPDVVLYEEGLDDDVVSGAIQAISNSDCLIIGGTSLVVYPAASFIHYFKGKHIVLINKSSTAADSIADLVIHDSIGTVLDGIKV